MKKVKQYYDSILGYIDFEKEGLFSEILKDPFFLRLHNIKQMGLAYYVFPDALHTRFSHSLGVYEIINRIISSQKKFSFEDEAIKNDEAITKIKVSALLHDIGHLPLSHTIEVALKDFEKLEANAEKDARSNLVSGEEINHEEENSGTPALHEMLGEHVLVGTSIGATLEKHGFKPLEIAAGFKGTIESEAADFEPDFYQKQIGNFLHSQLDADRLDYLLRDSQFSGVKTGGFDFDKLINSVVYNNNADYGVDISAVRAVEQFLFARYSAHCQIVANKRVSAFEYMAKDFYFRLLKMRREQNYHLGLRLYSYRDLRDHILKESPSEFLSFTDEYFFSLVREVMQKPQSVEPYDSVVYKYAKCLTDVQPLVPVTYCEVFKEKGKPSEAYEKTCFIAKLKNDYELRNKIASEANIDVNELIIPPENSVTIYKSNRKDTIDLFANHKKFRELSMYEASIISALADREFCVYRVFTFDRRNVDAIRKSMQKLIGDYEYKGDLSASEI